MKIAYVSVGDPRAIHDWSGLIYWIGESLRRQGAELEFIGPMPVHKEAWITKWRRRWFGLIGKRIYENYELPYVRFLNRTVAKRLRDVQADCLLATHLYPIAELETDLPVVIWCDSTFGSMLDQYPYFKNLEAGTIQRGHDWERKWLHRAGLILYACDWARESAVNTYGVDPDKIRVLPFGANIECDRTDEQVRALIAQRPKDHCNLLFLGKIWKRKGGDTAVAVARELNRRGLPTTLTLIGSEPPAGPPPPVFVRKLGFINKAEPEGLKLFNDTIAESHFLILPSRAEAFGIVFCEAASFGVPSLATRAGGIPSAVRSGRNGETFPLNSPPEVYADYIEARFRHPGRYEALAWSAWNEFQQHLNWDVTGRKAYQAIEEMLARRKR